MNTDSYPDLEKLCRLCLQCPESPKTLVDIFSTASSNSATEAPPLSIPMRIMACAALEVQPTDGLPKSICPECRYQLEKSYYFRKRSQLSDSKLRKHLRLLNLGKKSRVFSKPLEGDEFEDEDELDFVDSLNFIAVEEEKRQAASEEKMLESVTARKEQHEQELREKLLAELRPAIEEEVRKKLNVEWEAKERKMREEMRASSIAVAKVELRSEVSEVCRQLERERLLVDLEQFLKTKRPRNEETVKRTGPPMKKLRMTSPRGGQMRVLNIESGEDKDEEYEISESGGQEEQTAATVLPGALEAINEGVDDDDDDDEVEDETEQEQNYYILETDEVHMQETGQVEGARVQKQEATEEIGYFETKLEEAENFRTQASENRGGGKEKTTSYQIKMTGDPQYHKGSLNGAEGDVDNPHDEEDGDVIVFNFDDDMDSEQTDSGEFVNLDQKIIVLKPVNQTKTNNEAIHTTATTISEDADAHDEASTNVNANIAKLTETPMQRTDTAKTFKCTDCPIVFSTEFQLERHLRTHRKMKQRGVAYQCAECYIFLSCKSALTRHMVIHSGERPFVCEECGKGFVQREILKRHMHTHTGDRPHKCPHCFRSFSQRVNLTQHINRQHSEVVVVQQFSCHLCPKRFNHASGLSRHLQAHNGLTFQCTKCKREFGDRSSVKRHIANVHAKGSGNKKQKSAASSALMQQEEDEAMQRSDENSVEFVT